MVALASSRVDIAEGTCMGSANRPSWAPEHPGGPDGSGTSPRPPRRRARVVVAVVLVVFAAAITAAILRSTRQPDHAASPSGSHPAETPVAGGYTGDLRQLLLARPATAQPPADPISADGVLWLDQAALITHPEAEAKVQLQGFGYQRGAVVQWRDGAAEVIIRLFQFASPHNAQAYQDTLDETFAPGFFDQATPPAQLAGGHVYVSNTALDARGFLGSATAVRGSLLMIVTRYQPTSPVEPIIDVAASQYARLPAKDD